VHLFIDESQDAQYFVIGAIVAPDLLTLHSIVGEMRTVTRRLRLTVQEFHEAVLYRDQPRLLNQAIRLLTHTRSHKGRALYVRPDVQGYAVYYAKTVDEQRGSGLPGDRLMTVYRMAFQQLLRALPPEMAPLYIVYDTFQYAQRLRQILAADVQQWGSGSVQWGDSLQEKPLQLADLVAGTVRRHLNGDPNEGRFEQMEKILQVCEALEIIKNG
jgi:hypothetical protein